MRQYGPAGDKQNRFNKTVVSYYSPVEYDGPTHAVVAVRCQVKAVMAAAGVVTVIVLTQVNAASILVLTFVVVCTPIFIIVTHSN